MARRAPWRLAAVMGRGWVSGESSMTKLPDSSSSSSFFFFIVYFCLPSLGCLFSLILSLRREGYNEFHSLASEKVFTLYLFLFCAFSRYVPRTSLKLFFDSYKLKKKSLQPIKKGAR